MDYILQLRQYIGHRPILMMGAVVLILDQEHRLLMMKRTDSGLWGLPGGAIEPGEFVEEAAKRETREETNIEIGEMSLFGVFSGPDLYYKLMLRTSPRIQTTHEKMLPENRGAGIRPHPCFRASLGYSA